MKLKNLAIVGIIAVLLISFGSCSDKEHWVGSSFTAPVTARVTDSRGYFEGTVRVDRRDFKLFNVSDDIRDVRFYESWIKFINLYDNDRIHEVSIAINGNHVYTYNKRRAPNSSGEIIIDRDPLLDAMMNDLTYDLRKRNFDITIYGYTTIPQGEDIEVDLTATVDLLIRD